MKACFGDKQRQMVAVRLEINLQTVGLIWQSTGASDALSNTIHYLILLQTFSGGGVKILPLSVSILSYIFKEHLKKTVYKC